MIAPTVIWHDIECGGYRADLSLWAELAEREPGPILDIGAGTGRVALALARAGHEVTALDRDPELLEVLRARAGKVAIQTATADATTFDLGLRFGLIIVPMQTVQLLTDRSRFLACARAHLHSGGLLALAITSALEPFDDPAVLPEPDVAVAGGRRFISQPVAVRALHGRTRIERVRTIVASDGGCSSEDDLIDLFTVSAADLEASDGFTPEPAVEIAATGYHVGSTVVMLRG